MKIQFIFSPQFNSVLDSSYVEPKNLRVIQKKLATFWLEMGPEIEKTFYKWTKLRFQEKQINCYLNTMATFSDPLSLKIESIADMKDNLIHELIHVLLSQNYIKIKKEWDSFYLKRFTTETKLTRTHLIVHSLHLLLAQELMPESVKQIKTYSIMHDYVRSWEIVKEHSPQTLLSMVFRG